MYVALCVPSYHAADPTYRALLPLAHACRARGHAVCILAGEWQGEAPQDADHVTMPWYIRLRGRLPPGGQTGYLRWLRGVFRRSPAGCTVGWGLPGIDVECASTDAEDGPELLPPGLAAAPTEPAATRQIRRSLGLPDTAVVLAMVGGDLVAPGFERVLFAIAAMPANVRERLHLIAAGKLSPRFLQAARVLGLTQRVHVCDAGLAPQEPLPSDNASCPSPSRPITLSNFAETAKSDRLLDDVLGDADVLVDLPYAASANAAIFDALARGCIVVTTEDVAESAHVRDARAGVVLTFPYVQATCNRALLDCMTAATENAPCWGHWREQGRKFARQPQHYGQIDRLVQRIEAHLTSPSPAAAAEPGTAPEPPKREPSALAVRPGAHP